MTINDLKSHIVLGLCNVSEHPEIEADYIICEILKIPKHHIHTKSDLQATASQIKRIKNIIAERQQNKPLAYILKKKEFYGIEFSVNRYALIPRPETELIVDYVLKYLLANASQKFNLIDLGTGSGCIPISILANSNNIKSFTAIDISAKALLVANRNRTNLLTKKQQKLLKLKRADMKTFNTKDKFDIIISNPPYIPSNEILLLPATVRDYEPRSALDGEQDGTLFYQSLYRFIDSNMNPNSFAILEINSDYSDKIVKIFKNHKIQVMKDYRKYDRFIIVTP